MNQLTAHTTSNQTTSGVQSDQHSNSSTLKREVAIIDKGVTDWQSLVDQVHAGIEIVLLEPGEDGLAQLAEWASANQSGGYTAVHILSHGADGTVYLGNDKLDAASLADNRVKTVLADIGKALADDGDILLYGCEVASSDSGRAFIARLAEITGADVAASDDLTGNAALAGDWDLEASHGTIGVYDLALTYPGSYQGVFQPVFVIPEIVYPDTNTNPITTQIYSRPNSVGDQWTINFTQSVQINDYYVERTPRGMFEFSVDNGLTWTELSATNAHVSGLVNFRYRDTSTSTTAPASDSVSGYQTFRYIAEHNVSHNMAYWTNVTIDNAPTGINTSTTDAWTDTTLGNVISVLTPEDTGSMTRGVWTLESQSHAGLVTLDSNVSVGNTAKLVLNGALPAAGQTFTVTVRYNDYFQTDSNGAAIANEGFRKTFTFDVKPEATTDLPGMGADIALNTTVVGGQYTPVATRLTNGSYVTAWTSGSHGDTDGTTSVVVQLLDANGSKTGGEIVISTANGLSETMPRVLALNDGRYVVAYSSVNADYSATSIVFRIVEADGTVGVERVANVASDRYESGYLDIISSGTSEFMIVWDSSTADYSSQDILARRFSATDGAPMTGTAGEEFVAVASTVSTDKYPNMPALTKMADGYALSWIQADGTYARINGGVPFKITDVAGGADLATLNDGSLVAVWGDSGSIQFQRYNTAGEKVGVQVRADAAGGTGASAPQVAELGGGGFVITWQSTTGDYLGNGILGRRFNADGTAVDTTDVQINEHRRDNQTTVFVTKGDGNGFLAVWSDDNADAASGMTGTATPGVEGRLYQAAAPNTSPTLTQITALGTQEDTQTAITLSDLLNGGDENDTDGNVDAFVVKAVSTGTLLIGDSAQTATAWAAGTNDVIDGTKQAFWTPATNQNSIASGGNLSAFTVVARDNGGAVSATPVQVAVTVAAVNDAPVISGNDALNGITEDVVSSDTESGATYPNMGDSVYDLLGKAGITFSDADGNGHVGIAIAGDASDPVTQGRWQYSTDQDVFLWRDIGAVSATAALLLEAGSGSSAYLRFVPVANYHGTPGALTIHVVDNSDTNVQSDGYSKWDGTTETRHTFNTTTDTASSSVSAGTATLSVTVSAENDAPVISHLTVADNQTVAATDAASLIDRGTAVTVTDVDHPDLGIATFSATIASGRATGDVIGIRTGAGVTVDSGSGAVSVGGTQIGTFAAGGTGAGSEGLVINLIAGATPERIATLVQNLTFDTTGTQAGDRVIEVFVTDSANAKSNVASTTISVTSSPMVTITADKTALKANETSQVTFTFSEMPNGFDASDVKITGDNGSLGTLTQDPLDGKIYRAVFTPSNNVQSVTASISVEAGKFTSASNEPNVASNTLSIAGDTAAPTVDSIQRYNPLAGTTNADNVTYRVIFSETVANVDAADFVITGASTTIAAVNTADNKIYDITVSGGNLSAFNGEVGLTFDANKTINDTAGNTLGDVTLAPQQHQSYTLDNAVQTPTPALAVDTGNGADFVTSNGLVNVAGIEAGATWQYTVNGGTDWSNGSGSSFTLNPATYGSGQIKVRQTDAAGNHSQEGSLGAVTVDTTAPGIASILRHLPASAATNADSLTYRVTFDEAVSNLDAADFSVGGASGTTTTVTHVSGNTYEIAVSGGDLAGLNATVTLSLANGHNITDVAGNALTNATPSGASDNVYTVDNTAPVVESIIRLNPSAARTNADSVTYRVTFSEAVANLGSGDFMVTGANAGVSAVQAIDNKTYDITVSGGDLATYDGTVTLAFAGGHDIADVAGNSLSPAAPTGINDPVYMLDNSIDAPTMALAQDSGSSATDGVTSNGQANISLAADVASWEYSVNGGVNWTPGTGTHFILTPATYQAGAIRVRQTDTAGNQSQSYSNVAAITVDVAASVPVMSLAVDTGSSSSDAITTDGTVNVAGLETGATWEYSLNGGNNWLSGSGSSFTLPQAVHGTDTIKVRQTDSAGNVSTAASNSAALTVDAAAPTLTSVTRATLAQPSGTNSFTVEVVYADNAAGIDASTITISDIVITGPGSVGPLTVSAATFNAATGTATYTVDAPAGGWNPAAHAGSYSISMAGGEVRDLAGNSVAGAATAHTFSVSFNASPVISSDGGGSTGTIGVAETKTAVTTVAATDADQHTVSYAITGGADAGKFLIDTTTGALTFAVAPLYSSVTSNSYAVQVTASDAHGGSDIQDLTVNVLADLDRDGSADAVDSDIDNDGRLNTAEDPVPGANGGTGDGNGDGIADSRQINVASLTTAVAGNPFATLAVADGLTLTGVSATAAPGGMPRNVKLPVGQFDFTIGNVTPGATVEMSIYVDSSLKVNGYFKQDNSGKWVSVAKSVTTFGSKTKITFDLVDGGPLDSDKTVNGSITDPGGVALIAPLIGSNGGETVATVSVAEMTKAVTTVNAAAPSTVTYSLTGGADMAKFTINGATGALSFVDAPDFESPKDVGDTAGNNTYVVEVTALADGETDVQTLTVKVTDVDETPAPSPTPTPVTPPKTATVDGVTVGTGTVTNTDGSTSQVVTIPVVAPTRSEEIGNNTVADIPLIKNDTGGILLTAQVPTGIGLQVQGSAAPKAAGTSVTDLIREIKAHTTEGSQDQNQLTGGGSGFLQGLPADAPLLVQTIVPTVAANSSAPAEPLVITGSTQTTGNPMTALVIDTRGLPSGTVIQLQNVEFAAVIGAVRVTGGEGSQNVWGDGSAQYIVLGADDDVLHGGAGDDTIGSAGGNDQIFGDEGDDLVFGGIGNDAVDGGTGIDTVRFVGTGRADYTMRVENGKLTATHRNGGIDGTDTVANVEKLNFTGVDADMTARGIITRMYDAMFDRAPDPQGLEYWIKMNGTGMSMTDIANQFVISPESQALLGSQNNAQFVDDLYQRSLGRAADSAGREYWIGLLEQGKAERATVMYAFANSEEKLAQEKANGYTLDFNRTDVATFVRMYDTLFDRKADTAGLNHWIAASENGMAIRDIAWNFIHSDEALATFGVMSNKQFVEHLYQAGLERQGSSAEVAAWAWQLDNGAISRADALLGFADSAEKIDLVGVMSTSIETL